MSYSKIYADICEQKTNEALDFKWAEDHIDETEMPDSELTYYPEQHAKK